MGEAGMSDLLKLILVSSGLLGGLVSVLLYVARQVFSGKYFPVSWVEKERQHYLEQLNREQQISENYQKSTENFVLALDRQGQHLEKILDGQDFLKDFVMALKQAMEADARDRRSLPKGRGQ